MEQEAFPLTPEIQSDAERLGGEFMVRILEVETSRHPGNVEALAELGHAYTRMGRHQDGLRVDRMLVRLLPQDATVHYNLSCSHALLERIDAALDSLQEAVRLGYADAEFMAKDGDLDRLRQEPRFRDLMEALSQSA